jgi:hypothetical protein
VPHPQPTGTPPITSAGHNLIRYLENSYSQQNRQSHTAANLDNFLMLYVAFAVETTSHTFDSFFL